MVRDNRGRWEVQTFNVPCASLALCENPLLIVSCEALKSLGVDYDVTQELEIDLIITEGGEFQTWSP